MTHQLCITTLGENTQHGSIVQMQSRLIRISSGQQNQLGQIDGGTEEVPLGAKSQRYVVRYQGDPGGKQVSRGNVTALIPRKYLR